MLIKIGGGVKPKKKNSHVDKVTSREKMKKAKIASSSRMTDPMKCQRHRIKAVIMITRGISKCSAKAGSPPVGTSQSARARLSKIHNAPRD